MATYLKKFNKRAQLKSVMDKFTTFSFDGVNMFDEFGAFIINEKREGLKFYNGPGFTNEYTSPQFSSSAGSLQGVNFQRQTISFKMGVYWFTIEEYRRLMNLLNPLKVSYLIFGFNNQYRYNVKLSKREDSSRVVLGKEDGQDRYYTEMNLSFEVQGEPCAIGINSYEIQGDVSGNTYPFNINNTKDYVESDLPTPFDITIPLKLRAPQNAEDSTIYHPQLSLNIEYNDEILNLFNITFQNLPLFKEEDMPQLIVRYNSETGLLFLTYGNTDERLLTLLNTTDSGEKIIQQYTVNKFMFPGRFEYDNFTTSEVKMTIVWNDENWIPITKDDNIKLGFECYPRTNIL